MSITVTANKVNTADNTGVTKYIVADGGTYATMSTDYSDFMRSIVSLLTSMDETLTTIKDHIANVDTHVASLDTHVASLDTHVASIDAIHDALQQNINHIDYLASTDSEGIRTYSCRQCGGNTFSRAVLVNSLKQANQLENCIDEFENPTPVPGL